MKLGLKELKNVNVYYQNQEQPFAKLYGVVVNKDTKKIIAYKIKNLSLIPISGYFIADDIFWVDKRKMVLKNNVNPKQFAYEKQNLNNIEVVDVHCMVCKQNYRIKDVCFDFEIGEMTEIIMSKTPISSKIKVDAKNVLLEKFNKNNWRNKNV